jgi:hypothetical protein
LDAATTINNQIQNLRLEIKVEPPGDFPNGSGSWSSSVGFSFAGMY